MPHVIAYACSNIRRVKADIPSGIIIPACEAGYSSYACPGISITVNCVIRPDILICHDITGRSGENNKIIADIFDDGVTTAVAEAVKQSAA